ncbi:hypothetical protein Tco_1531834 [Tanacetum coccineum]
MNWGGEANSVYTSYIISSTSNGKIQAGALIFVLVGYIVGSASGIQSVSCVLMSYMVKQLGKRKGRIPVLLWPSGWRSLDDLLGADEIPLTGTTKSNGIQESIDGTVQMFLHLNQPVQNVLCYHNQIVPICSCHKINLHLLLLYNNGWELNEESNDQGLAILSQHGSGIAHEDAMLVE